MTIFRGNETDEVFFGGNEADVASGGAGEDDLWGRGGSDVLDGGVGSDRIDGGDGDDLIVGGAGADRLTGGSGSDMFLYRNAADSTVAEPDTIVGFETGFDRINLIALGATQVSFALDGNATLLSAETPSGQVRIRIEGNVSSADLLLAPDPNAAPTAEPDLLFAPLAGGYVGGGGGADRLIGSDFGDALDGGASPDIMIGGKGDDLYLVNSNEDIVFELAGEGIDTLHMRGISWFTLPDNVENMVLVTVDSGNGNALDNVMTGNSLANGLVGGGGNDVLIGGAGADSLYGEGFEHDHGVDRFVYLEASDSTYAAMDRLGFETGIDKIDLTALGPVGIRLTTAPDPQLNSYRYNLVEVATSSGMMAIRVDEPIGLSDFLFVPGPQTTVGTTADDQLLGYNTADTMLLQQGGSDHAVGGLGNDGFYFGAALDTGDQVDGGDGTDTIALQGDTDVQLGNVIDIEVILALSGSDTRFGDTAGNRYDYDIAVSNSNLSAGKTLTVQATGLLPGEDLRFDGSAELDGNFRIFAGRGVDTLIGGQGDDGFFFGAEGNLTGADRIEAGAGLDTLALRGNYVGSTAVFFTATSFSGIDVLALLSGHSNEYGGGIVDAGFDYDITIASGNLSTGQLIDVNGARLASDEQLRFDGRAEANGSFRILSGAGDDILSGGAGADLLYGGLGKDLLEGGASSDVYIYRSAAESTSTGYDAITGFDWNVDRIDIPGATPRAFSQSAQGSLSTATFDADLAARMSGVLGAGQAALFTASAGTLSGHVFAVIDVNGQAGYQAGHDLVIELVNPVLPIDPASGVII